MAHLADVAAQCPHVLDDVLIRAGPAAAGKASAVCKAWRKHCGASKRMWKGLAGKLGAERGLYVVDELAETETGEAWRAAFLELWAMKDTFDASRGSEAPDPDGPSRDDQATTATRLRFAVAASVRLRPPSALQEINAQGAPKTVLPLHQRVALVKAANPGIATNDALKFLMAELGRTVADPWAMPKVREEAPAATDDENADDQRRGSGEAAAALSTANPELQVGIVSHDDRTVLAALPGTGLRTFRFHRVMPPAAKQESVYRASARRCVADVLNGVSGCVLVYGFTGSGKTTTVFGVHNDRRPEAQGVVPRACAELYAAVEARRQQHSIECSFDLAYVEVYGNDVVDLVTGKPVGQNAAAGQRYVLDGMANHAAPSLSDMRRLLAAGDAKKRQAATAMNERSSRAHTLVVITLKQRAAGLPETSPGVVSRLFVADLGGAENMNKSKANEGVLSAGSASTWRDYYASRQRLDEAIQINGGLCALKNCIDALHEGTKAAAEGRPAPYVPYQNSKLTMLLSGALGGGSRTSVVVCASPEAAHASETLQALRFGERCGGIETATTVASAAMRAALEKLDAEIAALKDVIAGKEQWETTRVQRQDRDGVEWVTVSKLIGAEAEHERLEALANRRAELAAACAGDV